MSILELTPLEQSAVKRATVDVIVPCYNYGRYLRECVQSVLSQEGVGVRVLILDDASSDETKEVGHEFAMRDTRVEYRRHPVNCGHIDTYNEGLQWATGDFMLLLSADDALYPHALRTAASIFLKHPEVGLVYGQANAGLEMIEQGPADAFTDYRLVSANVFLNRCYKEIVNPVPTPAAIVRTSVQKRIGGYRKDLPHTADLEMWMRFALHGRVGISNSIFAFYRRHANNMTYKCIYPGLADLAEFHKAFTTLFDTQGEHISNVMALRESAAQSIAWKAFWSAHEQLEGGNPRICSTCLAFAKQVFPDIVHTRQWRRMRLKRLLCSLPFQLINYFRYQDRAKRQPIGNPSVWGWWPSLKELAVVESHSFGDSI